LIIDILRIQKNNLEVKLNQELKVSCILVAARYNEFDELTVFIRDIFILLCGAPGKTSANL
jgi:hypothetical protein